MQFFMVAVELPYGANTRAAMGGSRFRAAGEAIADAQKRVPPVLRTRRSALLLPTEVWNWFAHDWQAVINYFT